MNADKHLVFISVHRRSSAAICFLLTLEKLWVISSNGLLRPPYMIREECNLSHFKSKLGCIAALGAGLAVSAMAQPAGRSGYHKRAAGAGSFRRCAEPIPRP